MAAQARLRLPLFCVEIIDLAYRYIFLIAKTGLQISQARFLRTFTQLPAQENRRFIGHSIAVLFLKTNYLVHEIHYAMRLRGYKQYVSLQKFQLL